MFQEKVVWITGASSGIGRALAVQFAKEKAWLILSARTVSALEETKTECLQYTERAVTLPIDLADLQSLESVTKLSLSTFGKIDILINNGGISQRSDAIDTLPETEKRIMDVNYFSAVALTKYVLPSMLEKKNGRIVVISSLTGKIGVPQRSTYAASKHALIGYFDSLRAELVKQKHNIQIHIICPGFIRTDISLHAVQGDGTQQGILDPGQAGGMPVSVCANKIVRAIRNNKKEILIGGKELWMARIRRFIPSLYYYLIIRVQTK